MSEVPTGKPHAVVIPLPFQSHIKTILKLAKLLHHKGFRITFVNTERNQRRMLKARGPDSFQASSDFKFETIPDGLPHTDTDASPDNWELCKSTMTNWLAPFCDLLHRLNNSSAPVSCIVADGFLPFTVQAAKQLQIPVALFFTFSACAIVGFQQVTVLKDKGVIPPKEKSLSTNGFLDTVIDGVPGMKDIRIRDLPASARFTDPNDPWFEFFREPLVAASDASSIILHTYDALEREILNAISPMFPPVYAIGPLQLLLNRMQGDDNLSSIGSNLWKEETGCLQWLDSKKPNSVIYVNFGSITTMTKQQLIELGMGLAKSGHPFLWIIRPGMVSGDSTTALPPEFVEEAGDKAFITSWCPQEEVLNHPSIGGFLTHSGWGSTIESISCGVPMLCWPFVADQSTNCRYCCREWEIGMEIDGDEVDRDNVEKLVRELMEGDKGKRLKNRAMEWKRLAEEATGPDGSSTTNLNRLVKDVLW